jgi:hypothetical protein
VPREFRDRAPELLGKRGVLQHERALQIAIAVQSGRQLEVPLEQRARLAEKIENLTVSHGVIRLLSLSQVYWKRGTQFMLRAWR